MSVNQLTDLAVVIAYSFMVFAIHISTLVYFLLMKQFRILVNVADDFITLINTVIFCNDIRLSHIVPYAFLQPAIFSICGTPHRYYPLKFFYCHYISLINLFPILILE